MLASPPQEGEPPAVPAVGRAWRWLWGVLLVAFFLYVRLRVNPAFVYHSYWVQPELSDGVPVFFFSASFLQDFLLRPGGLVEFATAFLGQYHQLAWVGAAFIAALAAALCWEAFVLLKAFGGEPPRVLHLAPVLPLLALYGCYFDPLPDVLALVLALGCACLYVRAGPCAAAGRLLVFLAMLAPLHYAAAGAAVVYALLCVLFELTAGRRRALALLLLALGAAAPYCLGVAWLRVSPAASYGGLLPFHGLDVASENARPLFIRLMGVEAVLHAFYLLAPVYVFVAARLGGMGRRWRLAGAFVLLALAGGICGVHDDEMKGQTAVDYYAYRRMWPEVLENARKVPRGTYGYMFVNCAVNRALYHMGKLGDDMFAYGQGPVGHMLCPDTVPDLRYRDRAWVMQGDLLADLGCVNEAVHMTCEAMEARGNHPRLLELAALCNLANGRTEAARIRLGAAAKSADPVHRARARGLLRRMEEDPLLSDNLQLRHMRAMRVQEDVAGWLTVEQALKLLLAQNGRNRMAFEYLMGFYLIYGRLDDFVAGLGRLDELGYERIPRHYEEALLMYALRTGRMPELGGRRISESTARRFSGFQLGAARHAGRPFAARQLALAEYDDTYMFYHLFLLPPELTQ